MTIQYLSSKGPVAIDSMPLPYAANALAKLQREGDAARAAEIEALSAHVAQLSEQHAERGEADAPDEHNPRAVMGGNNPPADAADPFGAILAHCTDLYTEAKHWLDGAAITSDAEAEGVNKLLKSARDALALADAERVKENEPFDKGKAAIQAKYAPLIADTKATKGSMVRLREACLAALGPWRQKKADEAFAAAEAKRKEAAAAAQAAVEALAASATNLGAREDAEDLVKAAEVAQIDASRATKAATTGTGLTTYYEAVITDRRAAIIHYMNDQPAEFVTLVQRLADVDVRGGKRTIPGVLVEERKRAR